MDSDPTLGSFGPGRPAPLELPGFRVLAVAGRGGMGTVYRAEQAMPRRLVALKLLSAAISPESLAEFRREASTIARLEHPHILPVYGFGETPAGQPYLVLRYLSGGSVADRIRQGPIPLATAAGWLRVVASALDFAHGQGLVHRDVKPSNMLLDEAGHAYLTDFGIAGTLAAPPSAGQATQAARGAEATALALDRSSASPTGSAAYMAPEQGRGDAVDRRADVYALAASLFEMVTGQQPYQAETALGVIVRHMSDPVPSARAVNPAVPAAVDELIAWGMAKRPADRPGSAGELAQWLGRALAQPNAPLLPRRVAAENQPTMLGAQPAAPAAPAPPRARPSPVLWVVGTLALAAVCLVAVVAAGGGTWLALGGAQNAATATRAATARPTNTAPPPTLAPPTPEGLLLAEGFASSNSGFVTFDDADGSVAYAEGTLRFTVLAEGFEFYSPSQRVSAADVVVEVDVAALEGPARNELGVICRWQDADNFTALGVSSEGEASIWQKRAGDVERLARWAAVPGWAPAVGDSHHLAATCAGTTLRLEVDGVLAAEATDPAPGAGDVALVAGLRAVGPLVVVFDNLIVSE
jgi:serine/threonine-protein kinase